MKVEINEIIYIPWNLEEEINHRGNSRDLRKKVILKFLEKAKIVNLGEKYRRISRSSRGSIEVEIENGDQLEKLKVVTRVSLIYPETRGILWDYSEGRMTLDDAHVQLLPYAVAKKLIKT